MHFFDWAKKCQETHQHCMLDRTLFLLAQKKLSKKILYHMFGLDVLVLVTAFGLMFKVILLEVRDRCVYRNVKLSSDELDIGLYGN